jgi:vacuolar-type H+-ATPase subunit H
VRCVNEQWKRDEQHVSPEIAKARDATLKAMNEAKQGWRKAIDKIGERAGQTKGPDTRW